MEPEAVDLSFWPAFLKKMFGLNELSTRIINAVEDLEKIRGKTTSHKVSDAVVHMFTLLISSIENLRSTYRC